MNADQLKRFLAKVDKSDHQRCQDHGCWVWTGCTTRKGYGNFKLNGKMLYTHRLSYEQFKGAIPEGMVVRHLCEYEEGDTANRRCVNPDHLEVGTSQQNTVEGNGLAGKNARKTHCPKCGGDYYLLKNGARRCRPCFNKWRSKKAV
jgi:hypothetical protein